MQPKIVEFEDTRQEILEGARAVYEAVKATYSPQSSNVAIELNYGNPVVSHDGVTVARSIAFPGVKGIGAKLLIEASEQTNRITGDGTSATVILCYGLMAEANKLIAAGYNPMAIRRGLEKAAADIKGQIAEIAKPVEQNKLLHQVAAISAGDKALGSLIADTLIKVGKNGGVNVEAYSGINVEQEIVEGFHWAEGLDSPYLVNNLDMRRAEYDDVWVIVCDRKLRDVSDMKPILEFVAQQESNRLLVVADVSGQALNLLVQNKLQGVVNAMSVKAPGNLGMQRPEFLADVAALTGGKVIVDGAKLKDLTEDDFGFAGRVISNERTTTIYDGAGSKAEVKRRIKIIEDKLKSADDAGLVDKLQGRLAKLNGKIGVIKVGAPTETDRKEKMLRVEDAVFATKAARDDGIVPGGASTLLNISSNYDKFREQLIGTFSTDEQAGYALAYRVLREPFKQLMHNAGIDDVGYHLHATIKKGAGYGYNVQAMTEEPVNLVAAGVIDPAKVITQVVDNAISTAGVAITISAAVIKDKVEMRADAPLEALQQ